MMKNLARKLSFLCNKLQFFNVLILQRRKLYVYFFKYFNIADAFPNRLPLGSAIKVLAPAKLVVM